VTLEQFLSEIEMACEAYQNCDGDEMDFAEIAHKLGRLTPLLAKIMREIIVEGEFVGEERLSIKDIRMIAERILEAQPGREGDNRE
jgi:hypothetical protein